MTKNAYKYSNNNITITSGEADLILYAIKLAKRNHSGQETIYTALDELELDINDRLKEAKND